MPNTPGYTLVGAPIEISNQITTPVLRANQVETDVTNFDNNLSSSDTTVQEALETIDELVLSSSLSVRSVSANTSITDTDDILLVDASGGNITITMHSADIAKKKPYSVKKIDFSTNTVTIDTVSAQTIDGDLTLIITTQNDAPSLFPDGSNFQLI